MTLKIDIDRYKSISMLYLLRLFFSMPRPFFYRKSSSGNGLHIAAPQCDTWDYPRFIFDDPMRITLDANREKHCIPISNLLWDVKQGKKAGIWIRCETQDDIVRFMDSICSDRNLYMDIQRT